MPVILLNVASKNVKLCGSAAGRVPAKQNTFLNLGCNVHYSESELRTICVDTLLQYAYQTESCL